MPTYEYACKDCAEHLDVVQSFRDEALTECPNCQGSLRKVFSAAGIIFKGSGWHVKDYASSGSRPAATANSGDGEAKDSGATDSSTTSSSDASTGSDGAKASAAAGASPSTPATSSSAEKKSA